MSRWLAAARNAHAAAFCANSVNSKPIKLSALNALFAQPGETKCASPQKAILSNPHVPREWIDWYESCHALYVLCDGKLSQHNRRIAYGRAIESWCSPFWTSAPSPNCATCNRVGAEIILSDGATVCGGSRSLWCLIQYGTRRRRAASTALRALGIFEQRFETKPTNI